MLAKLSKKAKVILIIAVILIILLFASVYNLNAFKNSGLQGLIYYNESTYTGAWGEQQKRKLTGYSENHRVIFSNVYETSFNDIRQIRFRAAYLYPFAEEELLQNADFRITDSENNDFTENLVVYQEKVGGLNCMHFVLSLSPGDESSYYDFDISFNENDEYSNLKFYLK